MMCPYCGCIDLKDVGIAFRCRSCSEIIYLDEVIDETNCEYDEDDDLCFDDEFDRPEDYPDWDGDESIMYLIEHCNDYDFKEDEECEDEDK